VNVLPAAPELLPISNPDGDGAYLVDWGDVERATTYELQESADPAFGAHTVRYNGGNSEFSVSGQQGGVWYYRVRASNAGGDGPWSNVESVGVIPDAPVLEPISNADGDGEYLVDWNDATGAASYELEADDNSEFSSPELVYDGANSQFQVSGQPTGRWYYRVRAGNTAGQSPWSNTESVGVVPDAPVLEPIENSDGDGAYLVAWNAVTGATRYRLEEDDNPEFESPTLRYAGVGTQFQVDIQPSGRWYYRVRASNLGGDSAWSNTESAGVIPAAPQLYSISNPYGMPTTWSTGATSAEPPTTGWRKTATPRSPRRRSATRAPAASSR
jgi:hypothetical protein